MRPALCKAGRAAVHRCSLCCAALTLGCCGRLPPSLAPRRAGAGPAWAASAQRRGGLLRAPAVATELSELASKFGAGPAARGGPVPAQVLACGGVRWR